MVDGAKPVLRIEVDMVAKARVSVYETYKAG